jgi:hypothetical protein
MSDARNQLKLFSMGAAVLMISATEVLVGYHYFQMLRGFARVAMVGLLVVAWVIIWSTWWSSKAGEDVRVRWVSYIVAFGVSAVMIFNGAMVVADMYLNSRIERQETADIARIEARGKAVADVLKAGGNWLSVRELERSNKQAEEKRLKMLEPTKADLEQYQWVKDYVSFWIFFVPFGAALAGKFLLLGVIALPGGASGYIPSAASRPSPAGLGFSGRMGEPGGMAPSPVPSMSKRPGLGGNAGIRPGFGSSGDSGPKGFSPR